MTRKTRARAQDKGIETEMTASPRWPAVDDDAPVLIALYRVSTEGQEESKLGLMAQKRAVYDLCRTRRYAPPYQEFTEIESGRSNDRPTLRAAVAAVRRYPNGMLVVANLTRLSRDVPIFRSIIDGGTRVIFCDFPDIPPTAIGTFILTQMASVAELEARTTGERTKAALQSLKERGVRLGSPDPGRGGAASALLRRQAALAHARAVQGDIEDVVRFLTLVRQKLNATNIAMELNERRVPSCAEALVRRDQADDALSRATRNPDHKAALPWTAQQVRRVMHRAGLPVPGARRRGQRAQEKNTI
jgi:DNA invertase Pin-like site-specific DNA recombinase